ALEHERPETLEQRARVLVEALLLAYRVDPRLDHVLCQEVPKVGELEKVYGFEQQLAQVCRSFLFTANESIRAIDVDRAIFLIVNAVPGVIRAAVQGDPEGTGDSRLAGELSDMLVRYLSQRGVFPSPATAHPARGSETASPQRAGLRAAACR
ncbi:MAG: hypothetical protein OXT09_12160, partial [Myxococcales bacterium]|nr:hypothetical protein [Myxococcales bacterium]